jgi:putative transposase
MPRKPIIYSDFHPYHISARSNNRDWFDLPLDYCFGIFSNVLIKVIKNYHFELHAFVLMDNHLHMIVTTPKANISDGMRYFMTETARGIRVKSQRINHVYGGRYKPCLIPTTEYYAACIKYVYQNPVKARIVERVENYNFSTIACNSNKLKRLIVSPSHGHDALLPIADRDKLNWYNLPTTENENQGIKLALRRSSFKLSQQRKTGKPVGLSSPI